MNETRNPMVEFLVMTGPEHRDTIVAMMNALYVEDPFAPHARSEQFFRTVDHLLADPGRGRIMLFVEHFDVCGYALLIPFWSNEFGGNVLVIDEIYVRPASRNRGIARSFFAWLKSKKPYSAVALGLEVSQTNHAARRLYKSLGFTERHHTAMTFVLRQQVDHTGNVGSPTRNSFPFGGDMPR